MTYEINQIKTVQGRWMTIDEEIYRALDIHTMSLYTALRYEGDFAQESAKVERSIKYLCERAKIKRAQAYKSMNILENLGLIKRYNENRLGEVGLIYVSKHLGHFCIPVHTVDTPVHTVDTPVHTVDTYQESSQQSLQTTISESCDSNNNKNQKQNFSAEEIVQVYHETLPQCPKIKKIDRQLANQLKKMQKDWPNNGPSKPEFTLERFKKYLQALEIHCPGFLLEYVTPTGNKRRNNLRTFTREINIAKFINGEFNFS